MMFSSCSAGYADDEKMKSPLRVSMRMPSSVTETPLMSAEPLKSGILGLVSFFQKSVETGMMIRVSPRCLGSATGRAEEKEKRSCSWSEARFHVNAAPEALW